jgi:hypothetical protein
VTMGVARKEPAATLFASRQAKFPSISGDIISI